MEQVVAVVLAHFLTLLIPGVDFFLIVRTTITSGWRNATGACLGIALANGIIITAAFCGVSFISHPVVLNAVQSAGGIFLVYIGIAFLRSDAAIDMGRGSGAKAATWTRNFGLGLTSGLLNPKNALAYLSFAAIIATAAPLVRLGYGLWMFTIVLVWDIFVAIVLGSDRALRRMNRLLPWLTRLAGGFLLLFGIAMILRLVLPALLA